MTDKSQLLDKHVKSFEQYGNCLDYCLYIANKGKYEK